MERKASEILREAKRLIGTPEKWCKYIQRDKNGAHCAIGAIITAEGGEPWCEIGDNKNYFGFRLDTTRPSFEYLKKVIKVGGWAQIANWNNSTNHETVLNGFDRAIALAEADENKEWTIENTRAWLDMQYKQLPVKV